MDVRLTQPVLPHTGVMKNYLRRMWQTGWVTNNGEFVLQFEQELKKYLQSPYLVTTCNATIALQLTLKALDVRGEVITTPFTFPATVNAILWEGMTPVFADVDEHTWNLSPSLVENKITVSTGAIMPVHVFGNPAYPNIFETMKFNIRNHGERRIGGIKIIFDAAHAFLSGSGGLSPLSHYGDASIYSFHATKVFNSIEGGCITTSNPSLVNKLKLMRNHGIADEENVVMMGTNAKMSEIHACVGLENLKTIHMDIRKRKNLYERYMAGLEGEVTFQKLETEDYNYAYMPVLFDSNSKRNKVYKLLRDNGVGARKYFYPLATEFHYVKRFVGKNTFPVAKEVSQKILCLPLYPTLEENKADKIISLIREGR